MDLGSIGVWSGMLRTGERGRLLEAAAELDELGYGALWFPGGQHDGLADHLQALLEHTRRAVAATGIVSIWTHRASAIAAMHNALTRAHPGRFLLGVGVSHAPAVANTGQTYTRPIHKLIEYLDALDAAPTPVPVEERIVAALGPRALRLAAQRSLGSHPYFVPPEHTRVARAALGPDKLLAPEQMVVLEPNAERARAIARLSVGRYLSLPNYTTNLERSGFTKADFANGGSDRVVDAVVAWGDAETVLQRIHEHHAAGANHVCIQVLTDPVQNLDQAMAAWRQLAPAARA